MDKPPILLVSATKSEVALLPGLGSRDPEDAEYGALITIPEWDADLLITGPGIAATVFHTIRALLAKPYRLALDIGVAGSFLPEYQPGTLVHVKRDRFADLGSESSYGFITAENLPFAGMNAPPFENGWLQPETETHRFAESLPKVVAITSDTIHSDPASVNRLKVLYQPDLETMEGAAFFYTTMMLGVPCLQVRAVSNRVAPRKNAGWDLNTAVDALCSHFISFHHLL